MNSAKIKMKKKRIKGAIVSLASLVVLATGASSVVKGCHVNERLEPLREEFSRRAYGRAGENNINFDGYGAGLDYNGDLDEIVERRNQFVADSNCVGLGNWMSRELRLGQRDIDFSYSVFCSPF